MDTLGALSRDELVQMVSDLLQVNAEQQARLVLLEEEVARLRGGGSPPPSARPTPDFVKPNRPPRPGSDASSPSKPARKRRPQGFARRRETPTRVIDHFPSHCSDCGRKLAGGWVQRSRQVIEIPVVPVEVIEHRFMARHCGVCRRPEVARPDLSGQVVGQNRLGVRLMSLIGYLDSVCRLPLSSLRDLLAGLYQVHVSEGELVRVLHLLARVGGSAYDALLSEARQSAVVHADETGAREDGQNGYVWSLSTPSVRYYHRSPSRGAGVIQTLLGYDPAVFAARTCRQQQKAREATPQQRADRFGGVLVSDFYSAYSWYARSGRWHQRCLVHLDRDLDDLKAAHEKDPNVCAWVRQVLDLIERAKVMAREHREEPARFSLCVRRKRRQALEQAALALARPYIRSALPQRVLAVRLVEHISELFVFVQHPNVPADNNPAERAIRPFVIQRKISGGTRSKAGSHTQAVLASLFATWRLRGLDALKQCTQMLIQTPQNTPA